MNSIRPSYVHDNRLSPSCRAARRFRPGSLVFRDMPKKGVTPYVTHFVFRLVMSIHGPNLDTVTTLAATGTTENMKDDKMLDKMAGRSERGLTAGLPFLWQLPQRG